MKIPKIWRRAERGVAGPSGPMQILAWGWSDGDPAEAMRSASERLDRIAARIGEGRDPSRYGYGDRPLREEIIRELDADAIVTRNSYGALVLNTARVMFIDVDAVPESSGSGLFGRLFSRGAPTDPTESLRASLERASASSFRIYRTAAGFRLLATEQTFEPGGAESESIMAAVGADPQFVRLCRVQKSFRARLTPKPWRCGAPSPPASFPREAPEASALHAAWLADYDARSAGYATCRFVAETGPRRTTDAIRAVVWLHDELTRASSSLPLA